MSVKATVAAASFLFSSAHCWIAPSTWRRLLMHAFFCAVVRALMKLGMAIAASRPIMATTIIISTSVKPLLRDVLIFIFVFLWLRREHSNKLIIIITFSVHVLLVANRAYESIKKGPEINGKARFFLSYLTRQTCQ